jgi:hypothetical protein
MSIQTYHCDRCDRDFELYIPSKTNVPRKTVCPTKGKRLHYISWKPPTGVHFTVEGGTGAAKGGRDR